MKTLIMVIAVLAVLFVLGPNGPVFTQKDYWGADVASAATMTFDGAGNMFNVTGILKCTSITARPKGAYLKLVSASTDTLVDGGNLKLAGDFNGTADDVIVLVSDGTNWFEQSRSAN